MRTWHIRHRPGMQLFAESHTNMSYVQRMSRHKHRPYDSKVETANCHNEMPYIHKPYNVSNP